MGMFCTSQKTHAEMVREVHKNRFEVVFWEQLHVYCQSNPTCTADVPRGDYGPKEENMDVEIGAPFDRLFQNYISTFFYNFKSVRRVLTPPPSLHFIRL